MSEVTINRQLILVYALEGLAIGLLVSTINTIGSISSENVDEDKINTRRTILWIFTLLMSLTSHVMAESLRHDRIIGLFKNLSNSFKRRVSLPPTPRNLFRMK